MAPKKETGLIAHLRKEWSQRPTASLPKTAPDPDLVQTITAKSKAIARQRLGRRKRR
jgi:hypothetical protein